MICNPMKTSLVLLFGVIWGCSPQSFDPAESTRSQSFALQVTDVAGNEAFHRTRPSIGAFENRTAVRLPDGRVLVAGGTDSTLGISETNLAEVFDPVTETWAELSPMVHEHAGADGFLLKDGRVVILGGDLGYKDTPEIFDPETKQWTVGEQLPSPIWEFTAPAAVLLDNGRVLVTSGDLDALAFFFDTKTLTWSQAPALKHSRIYHSMTVLQDGRVLAAGGSGRDPGSMNAQQRLISEIFDPTTNQWSDAAKLNRPHRGHLTTLLGDGQVLLVDGEDSSTEIFDPSVGPGGTFLAGAGPGSQRLFSALVTLQDKQALLVGGYENEGSDLQGRVFSSDNTFGIPVGRLKTPRESPTATLLEDGRVLIAGGKSIDPVGSAVALNAAELFVPDEPPVWRSLDQQPDQYGTHTSTRLKDGRVLLAGFAGNSKDSFLFAPDTGSFIATTPLTNPRANAKAVLLDDGRVMVIGGRSDPLDWTKDLASTEFYDPETQQWSPGPDMYNPHDPVFAVHLAHDHVLVGTQNGNGSPPSVVELFDPAKGVWTVVEELSQPGMNWTNAVALNEDRILLSGFENNGAALLQAFDLQKGLSKPISTPDLYAFGQEELLVLPDDRVLVQSWHPSTTNTKLGIFEPFHETWEFLGIGPMEFAPANIVHGDVFWPDSSSFPPRSVIFQPNDEEFKLVDLPLLYSPLFHYQTRTTPLLDGRVLATGTTAGGNKTGAYIFGKTKGTGCSGAFECASGYCVDGYCCNEACDDNGSCNTCARSRGASENGTCQKMQVCAPYQCDHIEPLSSGQASICKTTCSRASDCATGYACTPEGLCEDPTVINIDEGCAVAPGKTGSSTGWWLMALGIVMQLVRRHGRRYRS